MSSPVPRPTPEETDTWLRENLPSAVYVHQLWRENQVCVELARVRGPEWLTEPRHVDLLVEANVEARRKAAVGYLSELGAAVDRATLALSAHDVRPEIARRLREKITTLESLAVEPAEDA